MTFPRTTLVVPDGLGRSVPSTTISFPFRSDVVIPFRLVHADGTAFDLDGFEILRLTIKAKDIDEDVLVAYDADVTDEEDGEFEFSIPRSDADVLVVGYYVFDIWFRDANSKDDAVLLMSRLIVGQPVTDLG